MEAPATAAPQTAPVAPETAAPQTAAPAAATPEPDLLTKVANFRKQASEKQAAEKKEPTPEEIAGTFKKYDKITDENLRRELIEADKKVTAEFTRRSQELARLRDENERLSKTAADMRNWSPQRIQQELLNNPEFIQAAQQLAGTPSARNPQNSGLTDDEFSALSDREKSELLALKSKVSSLEQSTMQAQMAREDAELKSKYPHYDPSQVSRLYSDFMSGRVQATREHLFKVLDYEDAIKAAYEAGRQDRNDLNKERLNGSSMVTNSTSDNSSLPVRGKTESDKEWFTRLFVANKQRK